MVDPVSLIAVLTPILAPAIAKVVEEILEENKVPNDPLLIEAVTARLVSTALTVIKKDGLEALKREALVEAKPLDFEKELK